MHLFLLDVRLETSMGLPSSVAAIALATAAGCHSLPWVRCSRPSTASASSLQPAAYMATSSDSGAKIPCQHRPVQNPSTTPFLKQFAKECLNSHSNMTRLYENQRSHSHQVHFDFVSYSKDRRGKALKTQSARGKRKKHPSLFVNLAARGVHLVRCNLIDCGLLPRRLLRSNRAVLCSQKLCLRCTGLR